MDFLKHVNKKELDECYLQALINNSPFKIGDYVKITEHKSDARWVIRACSLAGNNLYFLLECSQITTWREDKEIAFYYS